MTAPRRVTPEAILSRAQHVTPGDDLEYRLAMLRADSVLLEAFGDWLVKKHGKGMATTWARLLLEKVERTHTK